MDGEFSGVKLATGNIQKICDTVQSEVEGETNKTCSEFKAIEYRQQIVNGVFYLIKVHVGGSDFLHIYVFQSPPPREGKVETLLKRVEHHKDEDPLDPIRPYH